MSLVVTKDQEILAGTVARWGERSGLRAAARAEADIPPGERPRELPPWWPQAVDLGLPGLAVPESLGGAGAGAGELAVALAELGRQIAPGPLAPSAAAGLVLAAARNLASSGDRLDALDALVSGVAAGTVVAAVALDGEAEAARTAAGWLVSGEAGLVIGARQANWLLVRAKTADGSRWLAAELTGEVTVSPVQSLDVTRPMDRVSLSGALVPDRHLLAGVTDDLVRDLYVTAAAAEAAGIARWAVETATEYAKVRVQFGRPIGAFQAVKHLCADMLARSAVAAAAAWDAAAAASAYLLEADDDARRQLSAAACAAGAVALEDAVSNGKDCIQVLGGIGMTWEHDAHLSLRRAMALRAACGGTGRWRARVAELGRGGLRRRWSVPLRDALRADTLPADTLPADTLPDTRRRVRAILEGLPMDPGERRVTLAEAGLIAPHWRRPYGLAASPAEQLVIAEELGRAGIGLPDLVVGNWAVPTIIEFGSDAQRERFARPTLRGEIAWCQLFSEPEAGSDLAALRTRAVRVAGGWSLTGQKVWTSMAREADWAICLARTSPGAANHKGITYFLVDMKTPGIDVRPLREITGDAIFNEVFLDDVFVPDDLVVGDVDGGWRLARATLSSERVAIATGSRLGHGLDELLAEMPPEPVLDDRLGELIARGQAARALGEQITLRQVEGLEPGAAASIRKLVTSPLNQDATELALTAMGTAATDLSDRKAAARAHAFLLTRSGTIAGGSSQVLRNIIAERLLGLPRD